MAEIVSIAEYRERIALRTGFRLWRRFFNEEFHSHTRLCDLSPAALCRLSESGKPSEILFYSLILGFLGFPESERFETLDRRMRLHVVDMHLFLADQIRFEMMRRIGWLARFDASRVALFALVRQYDWFRSQFQEFPPLLSPDHPKYMDYIGLVDQDKQVFIRQLFQKALDIFKRDLPV